MMSAPSTLGLGQDVLAGHHHAHVDHLEVVALQDHGDDVLADVVHVALDGGDDDLALGLHVAAGILQQLLLFLDVGQQVGHGLLHHAGALHHLRQEHLALAEQVAHDVHAGHQRAFDHVQRAAAVAGWRCQASSVSSVMKSVMPCTSAWLRRSSTVPCAPGQARAVVLGGALGVFGDLHQALAGVRAAVQHHVFHALAQLGLQVVVHAHHAGVDDAHVHAGLDGVVQEHGVDGLAHRVVAAEAEAHVGRRPTPWRPAGSA
jgi:hypothetical protein